jgi:hypothetical protein
MGIFRFASRVSFVNWRASERFPINPLLKSSLRKESSNPAGFTSIFLKVIFLTNFLKLLPILKKKVILIILISLKRLVKVFLYFFPKALRVLFLYKNSTTQKRN